MRITTLTNPRQVILVTCRYKNKDNVFTLDWHMPLSFEPMMYAISVGKTRYSHNLIKSSGVFVVNFISKSFEKEAYYCGSHSGETINKFESCHLEKEEAEKINCPRLRDSLAFMECKVIKKIDAGDHTVFIAKVLKVEFRKKEKRLFHLYADKFTTTEEVN